MMRRSVAVALVMALTIPAQQPVSFRAESNLVVVNVTVRDRAGKIIEGLSKADFQVFEDDKPQQVSVFELQKLGIDPLPPIVVPESTKDAPAVAVKAAEVKPEPVRKDKRLMVLFFDFSSMPPAEQIRSQDSAIKFLQTQMTSSDLVSLMTFSSQLKLVQEFTDDRETLVKAIQAFRTGEGSDFAATETEATDEEDAAENVLFTADDSEFSVFNTDRKLGALEAAAKQLSIYPEKKALIYFSSGVGKTGTENHSQLLSTVNAAVKANVSIYALDARGLVATAPSGDATRASSTGRALFNGTSMRQQRDRFNDQQETLHTLAADTGGRALLDSNDLSVGIQQAQLDFTSYYLLGYYSTNSTPDGKFRKITVKLKDQQAKLEYRPGYYAAKVWKSFNQEDKERQLAEAMQLGNPATQLPLALEVNYFRLNKSSYFVPVAVKIPGAEVALSRKGKNEQTDLDFIGQVRDAKNKVVGSVRDAIRVKLTAENAALLAQRQLQYDTGFVLAPGEYRLKFLARENADGKMGTFETRFAVPDLSAAADVLRMSSVVWSNQREPLKAQVGAAEKVKKMTRHPLIQNGQKLAPSITRVYRQNQRLYVYFEVYDAAKDGDRPSVSANVTIYRGKRKAFESSAVRVTEFSEDRPGTVAFQFQTALSQLKPGDYTAQVNVVDEQGRRFAFSRAPLILR